MYFSSFILFEIHWVSFICGLISFIRTENFRHYHMQCVSSSDFYSFFLELGLNVMLCHSVLIFLNLFFIFFTSFCCHLGSVFSNPYFICLIFPSVSSNLLFKIFTYFFNIINFIFNYLSHFSDLLRNFHSFSLKIFNHFFYFFKILNIFIFNSASDISTIWSLCRSDFDVCCYFWFSLMVPRSNVHFKLNKNLFLLFSLKSHKTCHFFCWTLSDLSQSWFLSPEKIRICFHQVVGTLLAWNHFKLNSHLEVFKDIHVVWIRVANSCEGHLVIIIPQQIRKSFPPSI